MELWSRSAHSIGEGNDMTFIGKRQYFYVARRYDEGGEYPCFVHLTLKEALKLCKAFNKHCGESNRYAARNYNGEAV